MTTTEELQLKITALSLQAEKYENDQKARKRPGTIQSSLGKAYSGLEWRLRNEPLMSSGMG